MPLPHLADLCIEQVTRRGQFVRIHASTTAADAACPGRGHLSARVHSRYQRCLSDAAVGGAETMIFAEQKDPSDAPP
ncbi:hypothetical protein GCM10027436_68870 [Actinophytocola sediminis]